MMNTAGEETIFVDARLGQIGVDDSLQRAFSREKTKSFVARNIEDNVEDLPTYKKRAEMLEKEEGSKRKDTSAWKVLDDNTREHGRVPPNSPNHDEFEFDCWDYFSSIFFQLFPDSGKPSVRPKSDGFSRENSLDMWKEIEWRASREKLRESLRSEDSNGVFENKFRSEEQRRVKFEEGSRNEVKKKQLWREQIRLNPAERRKLTKKYSKDHQSNRNNHRLVLPEKPRNPFVQNRQRRKEAEMTKSMESTYEEIKNLEFKKASKLGAKSKRTVSFTDDNTCSVYFPDPKQNKRQIIPAKPLGWKANLIPKAVHGENNELSAEIKTAEDEKECLLEKTFDSEVKKYLVTCSFRLSSKKGCEQKIDVPKNAERNKLGYGKRKFAKQGGKETQDVERKISEKSGVFSPKVPEKDFKTRNWLFAEEEKHDKMSKYRQDRKELQDSLEKNQVLELKTRQFEFPVFQKSEVLCPQVKRVTFAPMPVITSKVTYDKKDYDVWSRNDKKTVKPIEIKWKM